MTGACREWRRKYITLQVAGNQKEVLIKQLSEVGWVERRKVRSVFASSKNCSW